MVNHWVTRTRIKKPKLPENLYEVVTSRLKENIWKHLTISIFVPSAVPAVAEAQANELALLKQQTVVVQPEAAAVAYAAPGGAYAGPPAQVVQSAVQVAVPVQQPGTYVQSVSAPPATQIVAYDDRALVAVADQVENNFKTNWAVVWCRHTHENLPA